MKAEQSLAARARVHAALGDPARLAIVDSLVTGDLSPGEIAAQLSLPSNLVAHHAKVLEAAGVIDRARSEGDRRRTYLRLRPHILANLTPPRLRPAKRVVFVCTKNSARSQLAAALWAQRSEVRVASAGTHPAAQVHPRAVRAARRHGLSLDPSKTAHIDVVVQRGDLVVAVCDQAHEALPGKGNHRLHWSVPDPVPADDDRDFEIAFEDIADRIDRLIPALPPRRQS